MLAAGAAAAALAAIGAPSASAAPATITGTPANVFAPTTYLHDAGAIAVFNNTGGIHDVTATNTRFDGPLFQSKPITGPASTTVDGTQYVDPGSYPFFCSFHPDTMRGSLNVAGTPLPRPKLKLKVKSKRLRKVLRSGKVKVKAKFVGGSGEPARIDLKLGGIIGTRTSITRTGVVKIKLNKRGRRKLARKANGNAKIKIKAAGWIRFGNRAKGARKLS